jgi:hypothetical protein
VIWVVAGRKGSSGATTLAALLAQLWAEDDGPRYLIEADPDGGALAARWHGALGTTHEPGLLTLAAARDGSPTDRLQRNAQRVSAGLTLIAGPPGPAQADASLRALGDAAPSALGTSPVRCIVDAGRLHAGSVAMAWARPARQVLFVVRPRLEDAVALRPVAEPLAAMGLPVGLVSIGHRPFHPVEVAEQSGLPLVGVVPDDTDAARLVADGRLDGRPLRRSRLGRAAAELATRLAAAPMPQPEARELLEATT